MSGRVRLEFTALYGCDAKRYGAEVYEEINLIVQDGSLP